MNQFYQVQGIYQSFMTEPQTFESLLLNQMFTDQAGFLCLKVAGKALNDESVNSVVLSGPDESFIGKTVYIGNTAKVRATKLQ